jgi:hypothetical protein
MDWRTFIAELLRTSAWPTVVLVGICVFRKDLRALLAHVKKGKVGAAEFEFERPLPTQPSEPAESELIEVPDLSPNELT